MENKKKLRFAVFIDNEFLKKWQVDTIDYLITSGYGNFVTFIRYDGYLSYDASKLSYGFRFLEKYIRDKGPLEIIDVLKQHNSTPILDVNPAKKKYSTCIQEHDLKKIEELDLDFALRYGFGILRGEVLNIPKYGIWSFHHGDPVKYRGGPAGFWEIYKNDKISGSVLQRLTHKLDGGIIIKEAHFKTIGHNYVANIYRLLEETKYWPMELARNLIEIEGFRLNEQKIETKAKIYKTPSSLRVIKFLYRLLINFLKFHLKELLRTEKWNVGVINTPLWKTVASVNLNIDWFRELGNEKYLADPFKNPESDEILCEEYDYRAEKGRLVSLKPAGERNTFLETNSHLSYPYSFTHEGKHYFLPENYEAEKVILHEIKNDNVVNEHLLLKGAWVDPTLIFKDNYWWLFCTEKEAANEKLHLFYSASLFSEFKPHPLNPIITDIRCARPAGAVFKKENLWFRLGQNCSKTYGGSIQVHQILKISPTDYKETFVKEIFPSGKSRYNKGIHTLSAYGDKTLVDGKKFYFSKVQFKLQWKKKVNKLLNR